MSIHHDSSSFPLATAIVLCMYIPNKLTVMLQFDVVNAEHLITRADCTIPF